MRTLTSAVVLAGLLLSSSAGACPNCQGGETAPTALDGRLDAEQQVTATVDVRQQTVTTGDMAANGIRINDWRMVVGAGWQPLRWLRVAVRLPTHFREMTTANLARTNVVGLGDMDVVTEWVAFNEPSGLWLSLIGGLRIPTAPRLEAGGVPVDIDAQPGTGAWLPFAGVNVAYRSSWLRVASQLSGFVGTSGRFGVQPGNVMLLTTGAWFTVLDALELGIANDWRVEGADVIEGEQDPDSGGWITFVSPSVAWWPSEWLRLSADVRIPVADGLNGVQDEAPIFGVGARFDWGFGVGAEAAPENVVQAVPAFHSSESTL